MQGYNKVGVRSKAEKCIFKAENEDETIKKIMLSLGTRSGDAPRRGWQSD